MQRCEQGRKEERNAESEWVGGAGSLRALKVIVRALDFTLNETGRLEGFYIEK